MTIVNDPESGNHGHSMIHVASVSSCRVPPHWVLWALWLMCSTGGLAAVSLPPTEDASGFIARLLINEVPFPGERGYVSETNTVAAMDAILAVVINRTHRIPQPYDQQAVAATQSNNVISIITAGGQRGQVDGFYLNSNGQPAVVDRVNRRLDYLLSIANKGQPGTFARLIEHAVKASQGINTRWSNVADPYAQLTQVEKIPATGYGFAWMADRDHFHPGGNFLRIPNQDNGSLGGNRFFTLRKAPQR